MKTLTENLNKILEGYDFEVNELQGVIDEILQAVKERDQFIIGVDHEAILQHLEYPEMGKIFIEIINNIKSTQRKRAKESI